MEKWKREKVIFNGRLEMTTRLTPMRRARQIDSFPYIIRWHWTSHEEINASGSPSTKIGKIIER